MEAAWLLKATRADDVDEGGAGVGDGGLDQRDELALVAAEAVGYVGGAIRRARSTVSMTQSCWSPR
jgi:hypothetical protein